MGMYLDPSNYKFYEATNSKIYVDKTGMISYCNSVIHTQQKYICVSRPRRFGKSMAASMLSAYYSCGCDSQELFQDFRIAKDPSYDKYRNQLHVLFINMQGFLSHSRDVDEMISYFYEEILEEVTRGYPEYQISKRFPLQKALNYVVEKTGKRFVFIIDEWDCIFREYKQDKKAQEKYLDFLRDILKDQDYVALAYMTGILPIKKYGTHSALNMFNEYSMTEPGQLAEYVGFTEKEVMDLCNAFHMDFEETKQWYDGYRFRTIESVYSPKSVVTAMLEHNFDNYWNQTESFEALKIYIDMNFSGLREKVISLMAGARIKINVGKFVNDMSTFHDDEDILTLLIHLGYLAYDYSTKEVFIPNKEISNEYVNAVEAAGWTHVVEIIRKSDKLLRATWAGNEVEVAQCIEDAHMENSHLTYSDENALSYTVSLAYFSARQYYHMVREMPAGKGYADLIFMPRKGYLDKPVIVIELKWDKTAAGAISQIKDKRYPECLKEYGEKMLLVGINYNRKNKEHSCKIEEYFPVI